MKLTPFSPKKALKAFLKQKPLRSEIDSFKMNLIALLDKINVIEKQPKDESEEHLKNNIRDFLRDTYYRETNAINTKDKKDLVIHLNKTTDSEVGVIIEAKRPTNASEMLTATNPNKKAFHELILYYLNERAAGNNQLKHLVATNIYEWFIIDANYFDKHVYRNTQIKKLYDTKINDKKDNPFFYEEVARIISKMDIEIPCIFFDLKEYEAVLRNNRKEDDKGLIALFKILSPQYLLKATANDSNSLDAGFYKELLHIIGLEEVKEGAKTIIRRKKINQNPASLIELTIEALITEDPFHRIFDLSLYGETEEERVFNIALELCITWINRVLFLKLLEGQLITYHQGNKDYQFLHPGTIHDFDELFKLFHRVLAVNITERSEALKEKYHQVPYLNSSLFEISELEDQAIKINSLGDGDNLELFSTTVLKDVKKTRNKLPTLDYLLRFLDAYDFSSEGTEDVQEDNKTIINASVLGKVFEKINGYKDGSIFTPAFITMYMCKMVIRPAIVEKFNEALSDNGNKLFDKFDDIKNYTSRLFKTSDVLKANEIINSVRICDPAVGSGHFLVSALNEIIAIKAELGILADEKGNSIGNYEIEIVNDELIITDHHGNPIDYKLQNGKPITKEVQRLQRTLFHEKQSIIENCLFGVDINPKSVLICRLRLWIELLKNAYYKEPDYTELETLPNIDINIKSGNSLLSRYSLKEDVFERIPNFKKKLNDYKYWVSEYKNAKDRSLKKKLTDNIKVFVDEFKKRDPKIVRLQKELDKKSNEFYERFVAQKLFAETATAKVIKEKERLEAEIEKLTNEINLLRANTVYKNAFEWRFEFPEILNDNGEFIGFDIIIGNPPYIQLQKIDEPLKTAFAQQKFETFTKTGDIYQLFYEQGVRLLRDKGQLAYITSNKWMRTDYGATTREFFSSKCKINLVVDFGMAQLFSVATTYTNIMLLERNKPSSKIKMCRIKDDYSQEILLEDYVDFAAVEIDNPGDRSWIAYDKNEYELIKKIIGKGNPLREWDIEINYGLKTGFNEAFIIDTETRDTIVAEDPKSAEIIKPILRGEDIKAYLPKWAGLWLINSHNGIKSSGVARVDVKKDYPAVYKWLSKFKSPLEKRYDKGDDWTNLRNCAYIEEFCKPKIIYPNMTKFLPFVYDKHQFFTNDKSFILTGTSLEYLTAFLNSRLFKFAFKDYFPELLGDTRELRKVFFENITIKVLDNSSWFVGKVEQILINKQNGLSTELLENEIDFRVFKIYELTNSECRIVLENTGSSPLLERFINSRSLEESEYT